MTLIKKKDGFENERHIIFPNDLVQQHLEHPLISNTFVSELGYYPNAKYHYRERSVGTDEYILIYLTDGVGFIELSEKIIEMRKGDVFCIPKKTGHCYYSKELEPWSILWIHFHTPYNKEFSLESLKPVNISSKEKNALVQNHFIDLFNLGEKEMSLNVHICITQLLRLILTEIYLLHNDLSSDLQNVYLSKSINFMTEHISQNITLDMLASHLKISSSYLNSIFKQYTEKSPIDFLIDMRIEQACRYLKLSNHKIYDIAKKVGYSDPYYFSRIFKKTIGYSPKEYRKRTFDSFNKFSHKTD